MGFNKGAFQEFNAQDSLDDESSYRTLGDHWINHSLLKGDIFYAGHLYLISRDIELIKASISCNDNNTDYSWVATVINTDLSQYITGDLTNLKAIFVFIRIFILIYGRKVKSNTEGIIRLHYSFEYGQSSPESNMMGILRIKSQSQDADNQDMFNEIGYTTIIPVVYKHKIPYITWDVYSNFSNMTDASDIYRFVAQAYLLGYFK